MNRTCVLVYSGCTKMRSRHWMVCPWLHGFAISAALGELHRAQICIPGYSLALIHPHPSGMALAVNKRARAPAFHVTPPLSGTEFIIRCCVTPVCLVRLAIAVGSHIFHKAWGQLPLDDRSMHSFDTPLLFHTSRFPVEILHEDTSSIWIT